MKTWAIACLIIAMPIVASALTVEELQAQLNAVLAQLAGLQATQTNTQPYAQPSAGAMTGGVCPALVRNLSRGMSGADVTELQQFLKGRGHLTVEPTGYFGALTESGLQAFQKSAGIVTSGTPASTGYGAAGPKTRAAITATCGAKTAQCGAAPAEPARDSCVGVWQKLFDTSLCHTGWTCTVAQTGYGVNKAPSFDGVTGPMTLYVRESGTWLVNGRDPEGGSLNYSILWGDEEATSILEILAGYQSRTFVASPTLAHAFARTGTFAPQVTIRDAAGNETEGRFAVTVIPRPSATSTTPVAVAPGSCTFAGITYPPGTETEGYTLNDLCLATNGVCGNRGAYIAKFRCDVGLWQTVQVNPYPNLPNYGNVVGSQCSSNNATRDVSVAPGTQLCRGTLCATTQNYAKVQLKCTYTNWVDWGLFYAGATTTTICAEPNVCEYGFGDVGRACAAKQNGACPSVPYANHPVGY